MSSHLIHSHLINSHLTNSHQSYNHPIYSHLILAGSFRHLICNGPMLQIGITHLADSCHITNAKFAESDLTPDLIRLMWPTLGVHVPSTNGVIWAAGTCT